MIVITARVLIRVLALSKDFSVTAAKAARVGPSWVKACTAWTDESASEADPEELAIQS